MELRECSAVNQMEEWVVRVDNVTTTLQWPCAVAMSTTQCWLIGLLCSAASALGVLLFLCLFGLWLQSPRRPVRH